MNEYKIKKRKKCARTLGNMEKGKGEGAHTQHGNENTWWGVKRIIHRTGTSAQWRRSFWKIIIRQIADSHEAKMRKYCSSIVPLYHNLHHHHIYLKPRWNTRTHFWNITSNTRKLMKARGRRLSALIVFECLKPRWNTKHEFLKLLLQQKKISLNNHLNKFSQFNYYIWDVKYAWCSKKCVRTLGNMENGKGEGAHTQRGNENTWWGVKRIIHRTGTSALCRPSFWGSCRFHVWNIIVELKKLIQMKI